MMVRSRQPLAAYRLEQMRFLHINLERDGLAWRHRGAVPDGRDSGDRDVSILIAHHSRSFQRVESAGGGGAAVVPEPSERWTITLSAQRP